MTCFRWLTNHDKLARNFNIFISNYITARKINFYIVGIKAGEGKYDVFFQVISISVSAAACGGDWQRCHTGSYDRWLHYDVTSRDAASLLDGRRRLLAASRTPDMIVINSIERWSMSTNCYRQSNCWCIAVLNIFHRLQRYVIYSCLWSVLQR